ncbi:hypothetical protein [Natronococcus occultus]|uniref:Uncharacterized protein n=1 Tax=Natronococcus occultus SP4 TaxID=694430 RepID=L0K0E1_9EURY|nr:hypothetical protein [Natronococcus occultus]AGB37789.1 hypothetical protein Natoc_2003 [Natronococcus occultus SP4]
MSTHPHYAQPEPTSDQLTTETPSSHATAETATTEAEAATSSRPTASERAPATFSRTQNDRLQNLIDEWNTAFAADGSSAE